MMLTKYFQYHIMISELAVSASYVRSFVSFGPYIFHNWVYRIVYMIGFIAVIFCSHNDKFFFAQRMSLNQMRDPFCVYLFCMVWHVCVYMSS